MVLLMIIIVELIWFINQISSWCWGLLSLCIELCWINVVNFLSSVRNLETIIYWLLIFNLLHLDLLKLDITNIDLFFLSIFALVIRTSFVIYFWILRNSVQFGLSLSLISLLFCFFYLFDLSPLDHIKEAIDEILYENSAKESFCLRNLVIVHHYYFKFKL